jgi:dsRNA-specific ribonuclease
MGGRGKQKALALIGDRLLDLKLYESLDVAGEEREGWMTLKRSMLVSNENLSRYGSDKLNSRERNFFDIVIEAYIGALYVQEGYES